MRFLISLLVPLSFCAASARAASMVSEVTWLEGKPQLEVSIEGATAPEDLKEISIPISLFDAKPAKFWQGNVIVSTNGKIWKGKTALDKVTEPTKQHAVEIELRKPELGIEYSAKQFFAAEKAGVQSYGIVYQGVYPKRKVFFTIGLNGFQGNDLKDIPLAVVVRDADDNAVLNRQAELQASASPQLHRVDVTPDTTSSVGPFTLEATLESEMLSLFFSTTQRFAQPNALLPISSMEHGDRGMWLAHSASPPRDGWVEMYYSEHLRDLVPQNYPLVTYDRSQVHSGRQSLKIEYDSAKEGRVFSLQELPGKALNLRVWVHGNSSNDQLLVQFHDRINFTLPAWQRNSNFDTAAICTLNYTGWKEYSVPVLGRGLQATGMKGSTAEIDGPVRILSLQIKPDKPPRGVAAGEPRSVWIDDLSIETQIPTADLLSVEMQLNRPDGVLAVDGQLSVSLGNGHPVELKKGKLTISAKDAESKAIYSQSLDLVVPSGGYANLDVPLKELAARNAPGPIEVDVSFADPTVPGARISRRTTLKNAKQSGVFQDFEEPITLSGYEPGKVTPAVAKVVDGGAEGSARSLALPVLATAANNSVLFHPALPGEVNHVEMMVKGGSRPVTLQPWFIDSGATGVWLRNYNLFWSEPIKVDWQDWRKVTIAAPPIPAHHGEKNRAFLYQPWYPLNFAINAKQLEPGEDAIEVRFDNLRVVTHLPSAEQLQMAVEFPDETRIHPPGSPLQIALVSYSGQATKVPLEFELHNYQGFVAERGKLAIDLPAGSLQRQQLVPSLKPGIYDLVIRGVGAKESRTAIMVLSAADYFGADSLALLTDPLQLRRKLGLLIEKQYLDWDNTEPAPYLHHFNWFEQDLKKRLEVAVLPPELEAVAARQTTATVAVTKADADLKTAQGQLAPAERNLQQSEQKLTQLTQTLAAPQAAAEAANKALDAAKAKEAEAAKAAATAEAAAAEGLKTADALDVSAKKSKDAAADAAKALADADKASKDADATVKPLEAAATAADKESQATEAARVEAETEAKAADEAAKNAESSDNKDDAAKKLAEKESKAKALEAATTKAADAKKKRDEATAKLDTARKNAETKRTALATAKQQADAAKTEADSFPPKAQAARTLAMNTAKTAKDAATTAKNAKGDLMLAEQAAQQALKKVTDTELNIAKAKQDLTDKQKAVSDAIAALDAAIVALKSARADSAAATKALNDAKAPYALRVLPVVGFSADWAGPEAADSLRKGVYQRYIPNMLQVPERLIDWSLFNRAVQREFAGRFSDWVFWENPDLDEAPQSLPAERYASLLEVFHRWVKLYSPHARVVAGGFNFDKVIPYLSRIDNPDKLPFDEIAVQMNLAELSPERADMEGFLDDLNNLLKLRETKRSLAITELDWGIDEYTSAVEQAAYHARAAMILNSRGASPHQFSLINSGFEYAGYGVFYRVAYGNTAELQTFKPYYIPKPSYFAIIAMQKFLADWKYVDSVHLTGKSPDDNRAFLYQNKDGRLTAVVWRAVEATRTYRLPAQWSGVVARDVFGFPVNLAGGLVCTALPTLLELPAGYKLEQLREDLRMLEAADGSYPLVLDLHLNEPESRTRAGYQSTGSTQEAIHSGIIPGSIKVREPYVTGLESETFSFNIKQAGNQLLRRRWHFDKGGQKLTVQLNDGSPQTWTLTEGQGNEPGVRESTFLLRGCKPGENRVAIRYAQPGNCAGYRIEPAPADHVPLERWGALNTRQTRGRFVTHTSAVGTPLMIGKSSYATGIGAHAVSFIEYPLDGQFEKFEVTVGIDGSTEGRGSVVFRIYVDGKVKADSGVINGFAKPMTLTVDKLSGAQRMILSVTDAGDGDKHDLANWVEGKLFVK